MYKATPHQGREDKGKVSTSRYFARAASEAVGRGKRYFMEQARFFTRYNRLPLVYVRACVSYFVLLSCLSFFTHGAKFHHAFMMYHCTDTCSVVVVVVGVVAVSLLLALMVVFLVVSITW